MKIMPKKNHIIVFFVLFFLATSAQEKDNHHIILNSLKDYYSLASENIHLHFNKNNYTTNETIWFKGYIIDKKSNGLNYQTTNVYVRILDKDKNEVTNKLFLANNGIIIGQFKLDNSFNSGQYYIHVYTNFMNNFEEDESSIYPIEITNIKDSFQTTNSNSITDATIELAVEGGKILYDSDNTIGIHIKSCTGNGIKLNNITVLDSKNNLINQFSTNEQGYGKFDLLKAKNEVYKIVIEHNSEKVEKQLPQVVSEGINISVNNYSDPNKILLKAKTNTYTFDKNKDKNYTLVIQKNDEAILSDFYFESTTKDIIIDKNELFKGVNIIRIVDENNVSLTERMIYNHINNSSNLIIEKGSIKSDSIQIKGQLKNRIANFSISVLPTETISSHEKNSIISQFIFNTYLLNGLDNYSYYFDDFNRKKQYELDLVLLNQNESKYNWNNILTKKPTIKYPFDVGLTIEGTLNQTLSSKDTYTLNVSSIANGINIDSPLDDKNSFKIENIIATDSTTFYVSLLNKKSKYEPVKLYSKIVNNKNRFLKSIANNIINCSDKTYTASSEFNTEFPYMANTTILKEVVVSEKAVEKLEHKSNINNKAGVTAYKITQDQTDLYYDVLGFIASHGYDVRTVGSEVMIISRLSNSFRGTTSPVIYVDDAPSDVNFLLNMSLSNVDEIYINKNGFGQGMTAPSGSIRIYTKMKFGGIKDEKINSKSLVIKDGFQKEIPFKNPTYSYYETQSFKKHGTIDWISNIYTDDNGSFELNIPTFKQKSILLNIQGIDNEGNFYYENVVVEIN